MPDVRSPPGLGPRGDRLRGAPRLKRPVRPVRTSKARQGIGVSYPGALAGGSIVRTPVPRARMRAAEVSRGESPGHALAVDLSRDFFPYSSHVYRGVEQGSDASLFAGHRKTRGRMQVRRVPLAVRREPPSDALEVVAQSAPHLSRTARSSVASETWHRGACVNEQYPSCGCDLTQFSVASRRGAHLSAAPRGL